MTNEEAHSAFVSKTRIELTWAKQFGEIIMIGFKRDMESIICCVEDDRGDVRIARPDEIRLANPDDWNPNAQTDRPN